MDKERCVNRRGSLRRVDQSFVKGFGHTDGKEHAYEMTRIRNRDIGERSETKRDVVRTCGLDTGRGRTKENLLREYTKLRGRNKWSR